MSLFEPASAPLVQQKANTGGAPPALIEGVILLPPVLGLRSKSILEALYTGEHLSAREIERLVDASHAGVLKALDRFGSLGTGTTTSELVTCPSASTTSTTSS